LTRFCAAGLTFVLVLGWLAVLGAWPERAAAQDSDAVAEPDGYRMEDYRKPVPKTLKGSRGVLSAEAAKLLQEQGAVFIDVYPRAPKPANLPASTVWREPPHRSIQGAVWLPNVGYGVLAPPTQTYFETHLAALAAGDRGKPLVFFCLRDCWMSWNASKRAIAGGFSAVYWFPEGTDAWDETGYPVAIVEAAP
jgi:PQQ-dependent catabolism-associated CXXCW motif protein